MDFYIYNIKLGASILYDADSKLLFIIIYIIYIFLGVFIIFRNVFSVPL